MLERTLGTKRPTGKNWPVHILQFEAGRKKRRSREQSFTLLSPEKGLFYAAVESASYQQLSGNILVSEGPSTQYLRSLVSKTIPLIVFGTIVVKHWVLGPSGYDGWWEVGENHRPGCDADRTRLGGWIT